MKLATWNCNSIRARLDFCLEWLRRDGPDILCLQETKIEDGQFPHGEFAAAGYKSVCLGQKTYNGVAILYRDTLAAGTPHFGLGDALQDEQKRVLALPIAGMLVISVYVPNGKDIEHPDFQRKLRFLDGLRATMDRLVTPDQAVVVCGDFNVAPEDRDVYDPAAWGNGLLCHPDERAALQRLMGWGLEDAFRLRQPEGGHFTWWDYRGAAFRFNQGLRIDFVLLSRSLARRCRSAQILREERKVKGKERWKPSDHAPVVVELAAEE